MQAAASEFCSSASVADESFRLCCHCSAVAQRFVQFLIANFRRAARDRPERLPDRRILLRHSAAVCSWLANACSRSVIALLAAVEHPLAAPAIVHRHAVRPIAAGPLAARRSDYGVRIAALRTSSRVRRTARVGTEHSWDAVCNASRSTASFATVCASESCRSANSCARQPPRSFVRDRRAAARIRLIPGCGSLRLSSCSATLSSCSWMVAIVDDLLRRFWGRLHLPRFQIRAGRCPSDRPDGAERR